MAANGMLLFTAALGSDAPGFVIKVVDGKLVIVPTPGWGDEIRREIFTAVEMLQTAATLKDAAARKRLEAAGHEMINARRAEIVEYVGQAAH